MKTQRSHTFVWHSEKYPALTKLFDKWDRERKTHHVTGAFNRWLQTIAEPAAQEELNHATIQNE